MQRKLIKLQSSRATRCSFWNTCNTYTSAIRHHSGDMPLHDCLKSNADRWSGCSSPGKETRKKVRFADEILTDGFAEKGLVTEEVALLVRLAVALAAASGPDVGAVILLESEPSYERTRAGVLRTRGSTLASRMWSSLQITLSIQTSSQFPKGLPERTFMQFPVLVYCALLPVHSVWIVPQSDAIVAAWVSAAVTFALFEECPMLLDRW